jgi:hypothetical protein
MPAELTLLVVGFALIMAGAFGGGLAFTILGIMCCGVALLLQHWRLR